MAYDDATGQLILFGGSTSNTSFDYAQDTWVWGIPGLAAQAISFTSTPPSPANYGGSYTPAATGGASGNPVLFSVNASSAGVCSINGPTVSFIGAGNCVIDANQVGDNDYVAAPTVEQSFMVQPAALTITASSPAMTYGGSVPAVTPAYRGFVNGDTAASLTTPPTCTSPATSSSPVGSALATTCSGAVDANYQITYVPGTLTVQPAALTITASSPAMTYGGSVPAVTPAYRGFVNGDTAASLTTPPTCTSPATSSSPVGSALATTCSGAVDANYQITYVPGTLTVQPAALTITASSPAMTYGASAPAVTPAIAGSSTATPPPASPPRPPAPPPPKAPPRPAPTPPPVRAQSHLTTRSPTCLAPSRCSGPC